MNVPDGRIAVEDSVGWVRKPTTVINDNRTYLMNYKKFLQIKKIDSGENNAIFGCNITLLIACFIVYRHDFSKPDIS